MNKYSERYDLKPAAAWLRGHALRTGVPNIDKELLEMPLEVLTDAELSTIVAAGELTGQKLYPFKTGKTELPRVRRVLSFLHGVEFETLLEVLEHIPEVNKAVGGVNGHLIMMATIEQREW